MADTEANEDWRTSVQRGFFIGNGQAFLGFDITVGESHTSEIEVTDDPVETGSVISDHAFVKPKGLELEIMVSDIVVSLTGEPPEDDPFSSIISRSATALQLLENLQASLEPFDVQTGLILRRNMMLIRIDATQDKDTAAVLDARLTLREIQIVSTETVDFPPRKAGKTARAGSKPKNGGEKKADDETDPTKVTSALASMLGVDTPQGQAIGNVNPDIEPELKKFYGPGSGLPD